MSSNNEFEITEIFAVHQGDTDRDAGKPKWWFKDEQIAIDASKGVGWYGGPAPISNHHAILIDEDTAYLLQQKLPIKFKGPLSDEELKEKALNKLTETDREVLGLNN